MGSYCLVPWPVPLRLALISTLVDNSKLVIKILKSISSVTFLLFLASFLGTSDSEEFAIAIREDKEDIWTINYLKKSLAIKRMAKV